jgi:hypothetical protein
MITADDKKRAKTINDSSYLLVKTVCKINPCCSTQFGMQSKNIPSHNQSLCSFCKRSKLNLLFDLSNDSDIPIKLCDTRKISRVYILRNIVSMIPHEYTEQFNFLSVPRAANT